MTHEELENWVVTVTAAQSMLLAAILRPLIANGHLSEDALVASLDEKERAAFERKSRETPALIGLIDLLRRDLELPAKKRPDLS